MGPSIAVILAGIALAWATTASAQELSKNPCHRPSVGSIVAEPEDLLSSNGELKVDLRIHNYADADGSVKYCYTTPDGIESPTLRVHPGDLLILNLQNQLADLNGGRAAQPHHAHSAEPAKDPCASGLMTAISTNLHFHGLMIPAACHQDEVLKTSIQPGAEAFEYRIRIPQDQPPGLYWYHPHIHGFSKAQVLGGASGALIVEGIERANNQLAGLPERVLIIRDQDLLHPSAPPSKFEPAVPKTLLDQDGDAANSGTGFGKPAKDLSVNFVPVPYPDYPPAHIEMRPGERQLWRVLNASAITYLNLQVLVNREPQALGLAALDGVPLNHNGKANPILSVDHLAVPPGARVEFIVMAPPAGVTGLLVTKSVDTGPGGENDPNRALATLTGTKETPEPRSKLAAKPDLLPPSLVPWLGDVMPARVRKIYFSEKPVNPDDPNGPMEFYITVDGQTPKPFNSASGVPNITAEQGTVEDWIIENRSNELHAFHIHQLHFVLLDYSGRLVNEPFLRDTINVPYYNGRALGYPYVRLRMDFRDPNTIGTFAYHCHLLEHEDGGMMGVIRVEPAHSSHKTADPSK